MIYKIKIYEMLMTNIKNVICSLVCHIAYYLVRFGPVLQPYGIVIRFHLSDHPIDGMQIEWNEFHFISLVMNVAIIFIFYFEFPFHLSYRNVIWLDLPLAFPTFMYLTVYWLCHRFGPLPYRIQDDFRAVLCNVRYRKSS